MVDPKKTFPKVKPVEPKSVPVVDPKQTTAPPKGKPVEPKIVPVVDPKKTLPMVKPVEPKIVPVVDPMKTIPKVKPVEPKIVPVVDPKQTTAPSGVMPGPGHAVTFPASDPYLLTKSIDL